MPRTKDAVLLLLATVLTLCGKGWGRRDTAQNQGESSYLASVRTYAPEDFRESLLDRLSGGLAQKFPYRMATDSRGRILVTDPLFSVVNVFDTKHGTRWQIRGDAHHPLVRPMYVAVDADDNIYVTDVRTSAVLVFQPDGKFKHTIGAGVFDLPTGIAVDKQDRKLYVADCWKSAILSFDLEGRLLQVFGSGASGPGQLYGPLDIILHHDTLVVLDSANSRFALFDLQGNFRGAWLFGVNRIPLAFAIDGAGNLFYVDSASGGLVAMDPQGRVLARFGQSRHFGQWSLQPPLPSFRCVIVDPLGQVLLLHPTLDIETVRLERLDISGGLP